jgi:hypothetical protein
MGLLQPHVILESKWECISMDFIVGFHLTKMRHDYIFLVVDTLMKSAHFIPLHTMYQEPDIAIIFVNEIVRTYGVPRKIIFNQGSIFSGCFWTIFQEALGTQLNFSTSYHPKEDGKTERMKQIIEYMM